MIRARKNLNWSRDLPTPLLRMVFHPWLGLATVNSSAIFEMSICTGYEDLKDDAKCRKWGGFRYLGVTLMSLEWHHSINCKRIPINPP